MPEDTHVDHKEVDAEMKGLDGEELASAESCIRQSQ